MRQTAVLAAILTWSVAIEMAHAQVPLPTGAVGAQSPSTRAASEEGAPPSRELELQALNERAAVLEAQGRTFEADRLRQTITAIALGQGSSLLAERWRQLETLQEEVDAIRRITGHTAQVMLTVTAIEISRTKLQELGIEPSSELLPTPESRELEIGRAHV